MVDVVEVHGGCPWRYGGRDGKLWRSLLDAFSVCEEGGTYSEGNAVPAVVRDRGVGGGARGSWRGLTDVVEFSAEESASKLSLGPRESGMVSTGRSAVSPELLEVGYCAVPWGRRTPADVRRRDRWIEDGNDAGVDGPGVVAVEPGRGWILLLAAVGVSPTKLARSAEIPAMAGMTECRASTGDEEGSIVEGFGVPAPSCPHLKLTA